MLAIESIESARIGVFRAGRMRRTKGTVDRYDWELDYPYSRQDKYPNGKTILNIEFSLTESELEEFKSEIKSNLNGNLPIRIELSQQTIEFSITKPGKGKATLMRKRDKIIRFLSRKIGIAYIPAVRTAKDAEKAIENLLARALFSAERSDEYQKAMDIIDEIQTPILEDLGERLTGTLKTFLPSVKSVNFELSQSSRSFAIRNSARVLIDDGTKTYLNRKGDGVQSLAALAMMRNILDPKNMGKQMILAIEEPESHLHPAAIHELKKVLAEISFNGQVILTTHNPLLANREVISSNILVNNSQAHAATSTKEIRESLGVKASDNLRHAELILIVEGDDDNDALTEILVAQSPFLKTCFEEGSLAIESLHGGGNLSYKISQIRSSICMHHSFLDNDKCGRDAFDKANQDGLINEADVTFTICKGRDESEMEDLYRVSLYEDMIFEKFGVSLKHRDFKGRLKWSDRTGKVFEAQGKPWTKALKARVKYQVSELVIAEPKESVEPARKSIIEALIVALEKKLKAVKGG